MHPKLHWLKLLVTSLSLATGDEVTFSIVDTVDPLKKNVILNIANIGKNNYNPLQTIIHEFAKLNDCVIHKIHKKHNSLVMEVFTKTRLGPISKKNPLHGDKA